MNKIAGTTIEHGRLPNKYHMSQGHHKHLFLVSYKKAFSRFLIPAVCEWLQLLSYNPRAGG